MSAESESRVGSYGNGGQWGGWPELVSRNVRIHEYSGEELDDAGAVFVPVIARTVPGYRGRMALHELGATLALDRNGATGA